LRRNVFVSGSASRFDDGLDELRIRDLCMELGESLIARGYRLICGVGLNVGDSVVKGAVLQFYNQREGSFEDRVMLRPFPRSLPPDVDAAEFMDRYRRDMIGQSGFGIFISGTSRSSHISTGVMQEYRIARELNKIPIAIGASGFAARQIWSELREEREEIYRGRVDAELYDRLGDESLPNNELVETVFRIIDRVAST
jgi:hypothetical protein